jgi:hypothetical protein
MQRNFHQWIFVLSYIGYAFFSASEARACSCEISQSPLQELNRSDAVFSGRVVDLVEPVDGTDETPLRIALAVQEVWKGEIASRQVVATLRNGAQCGYEFSLGKSYLVYAYNFAGQLHVSLCSRTRALQEAGADRDSLGTPLQSWPPDESKLAVDARIEGTWQAVAEVYYAPWPLVKFRADGVCIANGLHGASGITVSSFSYEKKRTLAFPTGARDKVLLVEKGPRYSRINEGWTRSPIAEDTFSFFTFDPASGLTVYPADRWDWPLYGVRYVRSTQPVWELDAEGKVTQHREKSWGQIKRPDRE